MANWFIGFPVSAEGWFERLSPPPDGVRLLVPADLHMTLAFLGPVEAPRAHRAFESLPCGTIGAFEIELGSIVPMGPPRRFSALSAQVGILSADAPALLSTLSSLRDGLLEVAGLAPDRRAMRLHVTLARLGKRASREERNRALAWAASEKLGTPRLRIDRVALFTAHRSGSAQASVRPPTPRAYDIIESHELSVARDREQREPLRPCDSCEKGSAPSGRE